LKISEIVTTIESEVMVITLPSEVHVVKYSRYLILFWNFEM